MNLRNVRDFIPFLNHLEQLKLIFRLRHSRDKAVSVDFICGENLIEVDFFDDHIDYSFFLRDRSEVHDFSWLIEQVHWNTDVVNAADRRLNLRGGKDLFPFLDMLKAKRQYFRLATSPENRVIVAIVMPGKRIDIHVFDEHVEYSYFSGDEAVYNDQDWLFGMIEGTATGLPFQPEGSR
jgi:hypothetical protein